MPLRQRSTGCVRANPMIFHERVVTKWACSRAGAIGLVFLLCWAQNTLGATINYGNFGPVAPGITFLDVEESATSDPLPLFGPPTPFITGLDFDPQNFGATASGGTFDTTDGQLNVTAKGNVNLPQAVSIDSISVLAGGDYSLIGSGAAGAQVGVVGFVGVTEIDGVAVSPINLTPSNSSVQFNLPANGGVAQPWNTGFTVNIAAQLTALGIPYVLGATNVNLNINESATAISDGGSFAAISQKDFLLTFASHAGSTLPLLGDFDGLNGIDLADYLNLTSHLFTNVTAMTTGQSYLLGDITADLRIDGRDFASFRTAYDEANGVGAFVAMLEAVPEPSSWLLACGACAVMALRYQGRFRFGRRR